MGVGANGPNMGVRAFISDYLFKLIYIERKHIIEENINRGVTVANERSTSRDTTATIPASARASLSCPLPLSPKLNLLSCPLTRLAALLPAVSGLAGLRPHSRGHQPQKQNLNPARIFVC